jgi:hypothetical protein
MAIFGLPLPAFILLPIVFGWIIVGQPLLNLLLQIIPSFDKPQHVKLKDLTEHFRGIFSRRASVHFLGIWFVDLCSSARLLTALFTGILYLLLDTYVPKTCPTPMEKFMYASFGMLLHLMNVG